MKIETKERCDRRFDELGARLFPVVKTSDNSRAETRCALSVPPSFRGRERSISASEFEPKRDDQPALLDGEKQKKTVVLVPVDFSPDSLAAAQFGIKVAGEAGGFLFLVHAVNLNLTPYGPADTGRLKEWLCREALAKAEPILASARQAGVMAVCVVKEGAAAESVASVARQCQADMIILPAQKRGPLAWLFGRRTSKKLMGEVKCPLLFVSSERVVEA